MVEVIPTPTPGGTIREQSSDRLCSLCLDVDTMASMFNGSEGRSGWWPEPTVHAWIDRGAPSYRGTQGGQP